MSNPPTPADWVLVNCPECGSVPASDQMSTENQIAKYGPRYERYCIECNLSFGTAKTLKDADALWNASAAPQPEAEGERGACDCAARFYGDDPNAHQLCCATFRQQHAAPAEVSVRDALEPFAKAERDYQAACRQLQYEPASDDTIVRYKFTHGHLRRALAALSHLDGGQK
ncbi:hypothetical protein [Sphingomonas immobilis]|uniref:Restriction alleviation protein, Lar family n=1 Tax=Sphingomonas immobilis TaxID=3063997 RepID=A0ABT8ZU62_9SPHN|nr:hypothetical protein [Sphingomonas sp. CA1-15]MDO7841121.1 hypothetical protein [Sphingomonas sp. CA1-15]